MFWGHHGELFAKSVIHKYFAKICKGYGGCENTFLELKKALQGSVMLPVPEKIGPEKSTGTGKNWSQKKVPVPVSEKIGPGTVEFPGTPGHCIFSYLHVPLGTGKRKCPF